jgi:hypothetical protein
MMKKLTLILLICGILLPIFSGCMLPSREFCYIEHEIRKQISPAYVNTVFKFSFGPISLSTARMIANMADADDDAVMYLREIQRVQVGVYEIRGTHKCSEFDIPRSVNEKLTELGWERFIRVKERDERVQLYYRQVNKWVGSLYVVVLERDEMVIVEAIGNLERIIDKALHDHHFPQNDFREIS